MNPNTIITSLNTWYRRQHPLHAVMYDKKLEEGEVADIEPDTETLRDTWHSALCIIPWPTWALFDPVRHGRAGRCLLESVTIKGVDQVPTGPGIVTLLDPVHDAREESPVCFQVFEREHPPILRVRALQDCRFVLAMMCDLYKPAPTGSTGE
jgi:hypothetical protein